MITDDFLYARLRELTRQHVVPEPKPVHLHFGEPEDQNFHEFELDVLEAGEDEKGSYFEVLTSIMCQRAKGEIGSVFHPLCCRSVVRSAGEVEYGQIGNSALSETYVAF